MFELNIETNIDDLFFNDIFEDDYNETTKNQMKSSNTLAVGNNLNCSLEKKKCNNSSTSCDNGCQQAIVNQHDSSQYMSLQSCFSNLENKRKVVSSISAAKLKRVRRFPGPAGLLPDRDLSKISPLKLDTLLESENGQHSLPEELCSQGRCSTSVLEDNPWKSFLSDLGEDKIILDTMNVASIKRKATSKCFVGRKVPFLAAILHHIDISSPDPCIILRDITGEIHGTLHREVWEVFAGELVIGSVLVIRNVGLLSTGISFRRHYLNITANNILSIYSANSDKIKKRMIHRFTTEDYLQSIQYWQTLNPSNISDTPMFVRSPNVLNSTMYSPSPTKELKSRSDIIHDISNCNKKIEVNARLINYSVKAMSNPLEKQVIETEKSTISSQNVCYTQIPKLMKYNVLLSSTHTNNEKSEDMAIYHKSREDAIPSNKNQSVSSNINLNTRSVDLHSNSSLLNPQVVFSKFSQLTAEEQSLVDNVFDGINADALFSDEF